MTAESLAVRAAEVGGGEFVEATSANAVIVAVQVKAVTRRQRMRRQPKTRWQRRRWLLRWKCRRRQRMPFNRGGKNGGSGCDDSRVVG